MPALFNNTSRARLVWPVLVLLAFGAMAARWMLSSPQVVLLVSARGAQWIRCDLPFNLGLGEPSTFAVFAVDYTAPAGTSAAVLRLTSLGRVVVSVDGKSLFDSGSDQSNWRREHQVPLPPANLTPGTHHLQLAVANCFGPSMVRADCAELGIRTDQGWTAVSDPRRPANAVLADQPWEPLSVQWYQPAGKCIVQFSPLLIGLFIAGAVGYRVLTDWSRGHGVSWGRRMKWLVLIAWLVLAANNMFRLPRNVGYDLVSHVEYIQFIATHWRPPLPDQGWAMFHPPLYYFISAILLKVIQTAGGTMDQAIILLRVIPLACGMMMVEICYRTAGLVFPRQQMPQGVAAVVGGLVPMNIYMAQAVSNEPLAACFAGVTTILCLELLCTENSQIANESNRRWLLRLFMIGLVLGLSIMTKMSGLIWIPPVTVAVAVASARRWAASGSQASRWAAIAKACGTVYPIVAVISGWYFVRNYLNLGVLFLTHSQPRGNPWWQYPGYRTPAQFLTFGRSLVRPVFGDLTGIWDDLYGTLWSDSMLNGAGGHGPPWNYGLMACGLWLSLVPMAALAVGALRAALGQHRKIPSPEQTGLRFALLTVTLFLIALMYIVLTWPIFSCVKSSYLLGTTPCLAVLIAAGFNSLTPNRMLRTIGAGLLVCWACNSYLTYFVIS